MTKEGRRSLIGWLLLIGLLLLPVVLLSDRSLVKIQEYVAQHAGEPWAPGVQYSVATAYAWSMRPEQAADAYETAAYLYASRGDTDGYVRARYARAREIEELPNGKYMALPLYEELAREHPGHYHAQDAKDAADRIRNMSRP